MCSWSSFTDDHDIISIETYQVDPPAKTEVCL